MKSASNSELMTIMSGDAKIALSDLSVETIQSITELARVEGAQFADEQIVMFCDTNGNPLPGETVAERKAYLAEVLLPRAFEKLLAALSTKLDANDLNEIGPEKGEALCVLTGVLAQRFPGEKIPGVLVSPMS